MEARISMHHAYFAKMRQRLEESAAKTIWLFYLRYKMEKMNREKQKLLEAEELGKKDKRKMFSKQRTKSIK